MYIYFQKIANKEIPVKLWKLIDDLKDTSSDKQKKHHATFKEVVKKILVGRQIESGIKVPIILITSLVRTKIISI